MPAAGLKLCAQSGILICNNWTNAPAGPPAMLDKRSFAMSHTVLVTGADGFIGSHLAEELVKRGEKVRAFCLYNSFGSLGWIDTLPADIRGEMEIFMGDVCDPNGVRNATRGTARGFYQ